MVRILGFCLMFLCATASQAAVLPGFRAEKVGGTSGFVTSLNLDSRGNIYYSVADGRLFRMTPGGAATLVATLPTIWEGNAGLLGMALLDDATAVVHYTTPGRGYHRVSKVDTTTGREAVLLHMSSDPEVEGRSVSTEHHGGNLIVAPDGSIFFGIGDFGGYLPASLPQWIAGKVWRLTPDGSLRMWAYGLRNPYDLAWDPVLQRVVVSDNGPEGGDELNVMAEGSNGGWPFTVGTHEPIAGHVTPSYVFPDTVAPTGLLRVSGKNGLIRRGYLIGSFVTKAIYYFPDITRVTVPVAVVQNFSGGFVIDVAEGSDGTIYFATGDAVYRLHVPARGDCNGDEQVDSRDLQALEQELGERSSQPMLDAAGGAHAGSWGCDANADSLIDGADRLAILKMVGGRSRAVRRR